MYLEFIEENLEKIENPNDIDIVKTFKGNDGRYIGAIMHDGEIVQLTQPLREFFFPINSIYVFGDQVGRFYLRNFAIVGGSSAINKQYLTKLAYLDTNEKRVQLYAFFGDGKYVKFANPKRKYFYKEWKTEIEKVCSMQFEDITEEVRKENELNR